MPKIVDTAELRINEGRRRLFLDGQEFPWLTDGISYERGPGDLVGYLTVRILVEWYSEQSEADEVAAKLGTYPLRYDLTPDGPKPVWVDSAAMLRRADVLGPEARMPGEPLAIDPDAPPPLPQPPAEQGDEGP